LFYWAPWFYTQSRMSKALVLLPLRGYEQCSARMLINNWLGSARLSMATWRPAYAAPLYLWTGRRVYLWEAAKLIVTYRHLWGAVQHHEAVSLHSWMTRFAYVVARVENLLLTLSRWQSHRAIPRLHLQKMLLLLRELLLQVYIKSFLERGVSYSRSVRPSRSGVLSREMKLRSCGLQFQVTQWL